MSNAEYNFVLGDDAPKKKINDDRLEFAKFAEKIAKTVADLEAPNGYVIGIHGVLGSGKSTTLNFVADHLNRINRQRDENQIVHIDFRPWIVTGHHDLIAEFFKVLSEHLGPKTSKSRAWFKNNRGVVLDVSDQMVDAAATVAIAIDPSAGVMSRTAGIVAKQSVHSAIDQFLKDPSLQRAYEDLRKLLKNSKKRFLVTIDDIDRLEADDVKSIMRMVKSIGQLPNVIYLLSYDRKIVWDVLDNGTDRAGPAFGAKIVQQELELPQPPMNALLEMLDQEIGFMMGHTENSFRWQLLLRDGVHRWVKSPRDVVRLSNAVKFSWPALRNEIDPQDLLGMEGVRLFDTDAFSWIRGNRDFLFHEGRFQLADESAGKEVVEDIKQRAREGESSQVLGVLTALFPQLAKWSDTDASFSADGYDEVERRRGIGCEAGYDSYFSLHPSADAVRLSDIDGLVAPEADVEAIEKILRRYLSMSDSRGAPMIAKVLHELRIRYAGTNPVRATSAMLLALFRVGEEIISIDRVTSMMQLPPRSLLRFLIYDVLKQWGKEEAGLRLIESFKGAKSPAFLADVYAAKAEELGIFGNPRRQEACISKEHFEALGQLLIEKIDASYENGTLSDAPFYFSILKSWIHLSDGETAKSWLAEGIVDSAEFMAKVCIGLVAYSLDENGRNYSMETQPDATLYPLELLAEAGVKHCDDPKLEEDERRRISAVVEGIRRFREADDSNSKPAGGK
ncbi:MAG: P-loop NTPase fold protein [Boseongicola sp.]|nr:P-loop NTPase fold protein [Boseongicola sp.]